MVIFHGHLPTLAQTRRPHAVLSPRIDSAQGAQAYDTQGRQSVLHDVREARRRRRHLRRSRRPGQLRDGIRRVLCACTRRGEGESRGDEERQQAAVARNSLRELWSSCQTRAIIWVCSWEGLLPPVASAGQNRDRDPPLPRSLTTAVFRRRCAGV